MNSTTRTVPVAHALRIALLISIGAYLIAVIGIAASYATQALLLRVHGLPAGFAWLIPATVDILALCAAAALQLPGLDRRTRWTAGAIMVTAMSVSIAANLTGGHNVIERAAHVWPVVAYLLGELLANGVRSYAARIAAQAEQHASPTAPAAAPTSPGMPPVNAEPPEVLAYRQAVRSLRATSALSTLNNAA